MIDREELERLHEAATVGPWQRHGSHFYADGRPEEAELLGQVVSPNGRCLPDLELLLYLRNAVPDILELLTERDTLAAENAALAVKVERLKGALKIADDAISEMFRYYDGGEMRGSYDGKPERNQLRKAGYVTRAALKGDEQ